MKNEHQRQSFKKQPCFLLAIIEAMPSQPLSALGLEPPDHPKEHISWNSILTFAGGLLAAAPSFIGVSKNYPVLTKALMWIGIALLVSALIPRLRRPITKLFRKSRAKRFVHDQQPRFQELLQRFGRFVSTDNSKTLVQILQSGCSYNLKVIPNIPGVNNTGDFIRRWWGCFRQQIEFPVTGLVSFMARCQEFTIIVDQFDREYVLRAHKDLESEPPLPEQYIRDLEQFRDDFNAYLRELEQWAMKITNESHKLASKEQLMWTSLVREFPRVSTFRRGAAQQPGT